MPFAVTLKLDAAAALQVEKMWDTLHTQGVDSSHHELEYGPHITLAVYPDNTSTNRLQTVLERITESWFGLTVTLSGLGVFPGATSVLWLAPVVTPELLTMHAAVVDGLPEFETHSHYQRGTWMPHVTLLDRCQSPERHRCAHVSGDRSPVA